MRAKSYLDEARANKSDEFYTQYEDIEKELVHYSTNFANKIVLCNCDDPEFSNFYVYFSTNFLRLKLKELICTHYANGEPSYALHLTKDKKWKQPLKGDGDFRSAECLNLLRQSDIIVTNPPFSLFDEFISLVVQEKKQYLVMGPLNALSHKAIAPLVLHNKIQLGKSIHSGGRYFRVAADYPLTAKTYKVDDKGFKYISVTGIRWYTNMLTEKDYPAFMNLTYSIKTFAYNSYDNLKGAIDVNKTETIPYDFKGIMGVPISFIDKYNPKQFELVGFRKGQDGKDLKVKGKEVFARYLIRKR
jgi:hypothetical protein